MTTNSTETEKQRDSSETGKPDDHKVGIKPIGIPGGQTGGQMDSPTGVEMPQHASDPPASRKD